MTTNDSWLADRVAEAVQRGRDVRKQVAAAVAAAARRSLSTTADLVHLIDATVHGAARAVDAAVPAERESTLRAVVDGIGDGLAMTAHAARLTLQEARSETGRFLRTDLVRLADGLSDIAVRFVDSVANAARSAGGHGTTSAKSLRDHAAITLRRVRPHLAAVADAIRKDPRALAEETLAAGTAAARGAAGAFCVGIGRWLHALGVAIDPEQAGEHAPH